MKKLVTNLANNQIVIIHNDKELKEFYSYNTKIAEIRGKKIFIDSNNWDYSRTTIKYLCQFLGYKNKRFIQDMINTGFIKTKKLN